MDPGDVVIVVVVAAFLAFLTALALLAAATAWAGILAVSLRKPSPRKPKEPTS